MPQPNPQVYWAVCKHAPTEPKSANGYTPEHSLLVEFVDDQEQCRVYFAAGLFSFLQPGDTVALEAQTKAGKTKWKLLPQQPGELIKELQGRAGTAPTGNAEPAYRESVQNHHQSEPLTREKLNQRVGFSVEFLGFCIHRVKEAHPAWPDDLVMQAAIAIFNQSLRKD